jgi:hypothetical protein
MITAKQFEEAKKTWLNYVKKQHAYFKHEAEDNEDIKKQMDAHNDMLKGKEAICIGCPDFLDGLQNDYDWSVGLDLNWDLMDEAERLIKKALFQTKYQTNREDYSKYSGLYTYTLPNSLNVYNYSDPCSFIDLVAKEDWDKFCKYVMSIKL